MKRIIRNPWVKFVGITVFMLGMMLLADMAAWSCDIAVVSARVTRDHRPFIWKDRDESANWHEQIKYFKAVSARAGGYLLVYNFNNVVLLTTGSAINASGGVNEAGFAMTNTSVYEEYDLSHEALNLNTDLLHKALQYCATLSDFDTLLKNWHLTHSGKVISGNFAAIDAFGGAAMYECFSGSTKAGTPVHFRKTDANTGKIVDELGTVIDPGKGDLFIGFVNLTNSNYYIPDNAGEERRWRATDLLAGMVQVSQLDYSTFMRNVAKDVTGQQLAGSSSQTNYSTTYCISRAQTRFGLVINGVANGADPRQSVMWCALGEPSIAVFLPYFAAARGVSYLAWVDDIGLNGTQYDYNDTCMLDRASNRREIYDKLMYDTNTGSAISGMSDKTINKLELNKVQLWTFPLEDFLLDQTELYMDTLTNNPSLMTQANLRSFSDYCVQYAYDNYNRASSNAVPWTFTMP